MLVFLAGCRRDFEVVVEPAHTVNCAPNGSACTSGTDCCSARCTAGLCGAVGACRQEGEACLGPADCCSFLCGEDATGALVCRSAAGCASLGQPCARAGACCSLSCDPQAGRCTAGLCSAPKGACSSSVECCGMAGSFGYKHDFYELSMAVGEDLFAQVRAAESDSPRVLVASGVSCHDQLQAGLGRTVLHPSEVLISTVPR